ncbi:DNA ligase D [Aminobacter sp. MET-1]|uniref:DNA ligase D n=1 Tax=Aminobacter sp. MET-1 TaxID=2951085 RepID=UPI00226A2AC1|nr:DNA ligase D [Aminobacter sp. MET-1]MCX8570783.1 DNA ligase D [Aminobacter sp. MET-1]
MGLETYRSKRDFGATLEPRGRRARKSGHSFVVQKHDASRLHYDFRLEMDGVLKSWAVTKGPSLVPGEKRLAVQVEDHPLEYGSFEGTIPKGEYGGGTVLLWDRGSWSPIGDAKRGFAKGHLDFELEGEKLAGRWHLVRMASKPREKRNNWLLIKGDDDAARTHDEPDILDERPESVASGRGLFEIEREAPGWSAKTGRIRRSKDEAAGSSTIGANDLKKAKLAEMPDFVDPALATLVASAPEGTRWVHEIKFDGYRLQAHVNTKDTKLLTRSGLDWTGKFGKPILEALTALDVKTAIIDGELVVEAGNGASDFSALQDDLSQGRTDRFAFYAFDLMHLDGRDLTRVPLVTRKQLLQKLLGDAVEPLRFSTHFEEDGDLILRHACRLSLEGIVSKLKDAPYRSGRSRNWLKSKCSERQEFVIAGYVPSTTTKQAIGSLVLGVYENDQLRYVGKVGTGYSVATALSLYKKLEKERTSDSPFARRLSADEARQVRFVEPDLVAEVEFRAWTADGILRHASFRGLREDKPAKEIVQETKKAALSVEGEPRRTVRLTHPDRLYWPDDGVTKEGLADYYAEVWRHMAPFVVARPLALLRCPTGINGQKFFQKHAWKGLNPKIALVRDPKSPRDEPMIGIHDLDGLMALVQSATLEIHPWGAAIADLEHPDMLTMDLDPGEDVSWEAVILAAEETRERLSAAGLNAFVKSSGGKGLHVVAPLKPKANWASVKAFTKDVAEAMAHDAPDRYVATIAKSKRKGKILVDYLRNQRGATAVAAYSTRARPGAAVSMPLGWDELSPSIGPGYFTVENTPTRLASIARDPWGDFRSAATPLQFKRQAS